MIPDLKTRCPPLVLPAASLGVAILIANTLPVHARTYILAIILFGLLRIIFKLRTEVLVSALLLGLFGLSSGFRVQGFSSQALEECADRSYYTIFGTIASSGAPRARGIRYQLACDRLIREKTLANVRGRVYLTIYPDGNELPSFGDRVRVRARLNPIRNFANPGGFDYKTFLWRQGIVGAVYANAEAVHVLTGGDIHFLAVLQRKIALLRDRAHAFIRERACRQTEPEERSLAGIVLSAMTLGKRQVIPCRLRDMFARAGVSHLLAISGLHLSIIGLAAFTLFIQVFRPFEGLVISGNARKLALALTLLPLAGYAVMAGFSHATQRALIMTGLFILAMIMEKDHAPLNTLSLAGILILALDPAALFSVSFQLSFAAVVFIISGFSLVQQYNLIPNHPVTGFLAATAWVSLFAAAGTFPLIARYFNMVSFLQVPANVVLVPLMGFICLPLGLAGLFFFFFWPSLAAGLLDLAVEVMIPCLNLIDFLSALPFAWSGIITPSWAEIIVYYLCCAGIWYLLAARRKTGVAILIPACMLALVLGASALKERFRPGKLTLTVLDVGQGAAALVVSPRGRTILFDCGGFSGSDGFNAGRIAVAPFLWRNRIMSLDAVVLSHPQSDHYNGLFFIMENFKVKAWIRNQDHPDSDGFARLLRIVEKRRIPQHIPVAAKTALTIGRLKLVLFPGLGRDLNGNSLVSKLILDDFSVLFPGDIGRDREAFMASHFGRELASDVLIAPHHGSRGSNSNFFLEKTDPQSVIVSCGYKNRYGFPHESVLKRYRQRHIEIFRTDIHGAVILERRGREFKITTLREH